MKPRKKDGFDFQAQLTAAIKQAPSVELDGMTVIDKGYYKGKEHPYKKLKDNDLIDFPLQEELPYQILTRDMESYLALLKQTIKALDKASSITTKEEDVDYEANVRFVHEMEHVEALLATGAKNPVVLGVSIFRTKRSGKDRYGYYSFMSPEGKVRKIDAAKMFAGPSKPSDSDKQKLIDLGYNSPEDPR